MVIFCVKYHVLSLAIFFFWGGREAVGGGAIAINFRFLKRRSYVPQWEQLRLHGVLCFPVETSSYLESYPEYAARKPQKVCCYRFMQHCIIYLMNMYVFHICISVFGKENSIVLRLLAKIVGSFSWQNVLIKINISLSGNVLIVVYALYIKISICFLSKNFSR